MDKTKTKTVDKCNICNWTGFSDDVPRDQNGKWICPVCGSEDMDDVNSNPYEDDEEEWDTV